MPGVQLFAFGQQSQKVTVGEGAESFRAVAVGGEKARREGARRVQAVFAFKPVQRGQGNAVSTVEMAERFKVIGFQLMSGVGALGFGLRLRGWIGAYSVMVSHQLPPYKAGVG